MLIVYSKANEEILGWSYAEARITENSIISDDLVMRGVDLTKVGYGWYKDKEIVRQYDDEDGNELPIYMADLNLEPMDANDLPISEHIGKLISVNPANAKPATVTRRFMGQNYDANCLVTQSVAELFQAGQIQINDYVLVSFIEENPNTEEKLIAIVTDKVYKSW